MTEQEFQTRLADLIRRHDCETETAEDDDTEWGREWEELTMIECDLAQCDRALDLYELHVLNEHAP